MIIIVTVIIIVVSNVQVKSVQGRGRLFVRESLQHRLLVNTIELLADNSDLMSVSFVKLLVVRFTQ